MNKVVLPPINIGTAVLPSERGLRLVAEQDLRARDLEVAKFVLEAAVMACNGNSWGRSASSDAIRTLEFTHD